MTSVFCEGDNEVIFLTIYLNLGSPDKQSSLYLTDFHRSVANDPLPVDPTNTYIWCLMEECSATSNVAEAMGDENRVASRDGASTPGTG